MTLQELLGMGTASMIEFINTMPRDRLFGLSGVLENPTNYARYGADPDYDVALKTVTNRCKNIEDQLMRDQVNEEKRLNQVHKAAIDHALNFTDAEGNAVGSWGVGSDAVKRALGK